MKKEIKNALINEMVEYGETYLGLSEIRGLEVVKEYKLLSKEIKKRFPEKVLCWDAFGTGKIWLA